jgi:hypothetical protein
MVSQLKLFSGHPYLRRSLSRLELPIRVQVTTDEYVESIGFTAYAYIMNLITKRDLMKNSERYLGEFLEHLIRGKLAEFGFKKHLRDQGIETLVDVDLPVFIMGDYLPDILAMKVNGLWSNARFWMEVKAVVEKQEWMLISTTAVRGGKRAQPRPYCAYGIGLVHLPMDHVARLIRYAPSIARRTSTEWTAALSDLDQIDVDILGYATFSDIDAVLTGQRNNDLDQAFGAGNWRLISKGETFKDTLTGKRNGPYNRDNCAIRLDNLRQDWPNLLSRLRGNVAIAPTNRRDYPAFDAQMNSAVQQLQPYVSWFSRDISSRPIAGTAQTGTVQAPLNIEPGQGES